MFFSHFTISAVHLLRHKKCGMLFCLNSIILTTGPGPWPVIGNIFDIGNGSSLHITLANLAKIHRPLMSLKLGTRCLVVASSPDAATSLLKMNDRVTSGRTIPHAIPMTTSEINQSSVVFAEDCNNHWKLIRALCQGQLFSAKAVKSHARIRERNLHDMMGYLREKQGEVVIISELVFTTIFNTLGNCFMSRDFIAYGERDEDGGMKGLVRLGMEVVAAPNLSDYYPFLSRYDLQGRRKKLGDLGVKMSAIWEPIIEERRRDDSSLGRHQDFLDTLIANGFTNSQIKQLFMELFSAGTDTTSITIEWILAEIVRNPQVMIKVCEEIKGAGIDQDFPKSRSSDSMPRLPYLEACIKESLRLHPPTPFLVPHRAIEECRVMGYTVPKDAQVFVNIWAIGRDSGTWDDPLAFKPERFLNSCVDYKGNNFELLPFGAGRRICPGLPFAMRIIPLILMTLLHFFDWSLPNGKDPREINMEEKFGTTMQMKQPLMMIPRARRF